MAGNLRSPSVRPLLFLAALGGGIVFLSLSYFALTSPSVPYTKLDLYTIDRLADTSRSGELRPGDVILSINGYPLFGCIYLIDSPIYFAQRNDPIPLEYRRPTTNIEASTSIILTDPSPRLLLNRSFTILIAFSFVACALIILLGGSSTWPNLLLGLASLTSGFIIVSGPDISDFSTPLSLFYWLGIPLWGILSVLSHALWPANQLSRTGPRVALGVVTLASILHFGANIAGSPWLGCTPNETVLALGGWSYLLNLALPFPAILYLLGSAYRHSENPLTKLQIRAIIWAIGLGFGIPLLFSIVPLYLGVTWVAPIELTLLVSGIIPLTYLYVLYRGDLLVIDRYLNRLVFTALFLVFWGAVTLVSVNAITYWIPDPDPLLIAVFAAAPPLLAATFVRERIGLLVDFAIHGRYYDSERIVSGIGKALSGALSEAELAEIVVHRLPQALAIRQAALWRAANGDQLQLVANSSEDPAINSGATISRGHIPNDADIVEVLNTPLQIGNDPIPWRIIIRLQRGSDLLGILLLGDKLREQAYGQKDIRALKTLADWMTITLANINHLAKQKRAAQNERRLMLALIENEERIRDEVAGELHDRGITALGMARLMVEQGRSTQIIMTFLERVIGDLRQLSNNRLSPVGLDQGLHQALEAMVQTQSELGHPVRLNINSDLLTADRLSPQVQRELFYIAQEAVANAAKHSGADRIQVNLSHADGSLRLTIIDDGDSFDVQANIENGEIRGLGIMQARANRIGGELTFISEPGKGTEITVKVDINQ